MNYKKHGRRLCFYVLTILLLIALSEVICYLAFDLVFGRAYSLSAIQRRRAGLLAQSTREKDLHVPGTVLHPYAGYVYNPDQNSQAFIDFHKYPVSAYGLIDDSTPDRTVPPGEYVIAITGGSVAFWFSVHGWPHLQGELQAHPFFANKQIRLLRLALPGYKQPQQFMLLAYLLALGMHVDMVINLDGFNEVALPPNNNMTHGVALHYPRNWHFLASQVPDTAGKLQIAEIARAKVRRGKLAGCANLFPLRYSVTCNLFWLWLDRWLESGITEKEAQLKPQAGPGRFHTCGPVREYADKQALYTECVNIWYLASVQMAKLCRANGIAYCHFLQPNQYVKGSKPMGAEEKARALNANSPYREPVERGYPLLRDKGKELVQQNVPFADLCMVFHDISEAVYQDDCCHFNAFGNAVLAQAVADYIISSQATGP